MSQEPVTQDQTQETPQDQDTMTVCAIKRKFLVDGEKVYKWVEAKVSDIPRAAEVRCLYCKGAVRLHFKKQAHGTADHCEHKTRQDSVNCRGGHFFEGEHRESKNPVQ